MADYPYRPVPPAPVAPSEWGLTEVRMVRAFLVLGIGLLPWMLMRRTVPIPWGILMLVVMVLGQFRRVPRWPHPWRRSFVRSFQTLRRWRDARKWAGGTWVYGFKVNIQEGTTGPDCWWPVDDSHGLGEFPESSREDWG